MSLQPTIWKSVALGRFVSFFTFARRFVVLCCVSTYFLVMFRSSFVLVVFCCFSLLFCLVTFHFLFYVNTFLLFHIPLFHFMDTYTRLVSSPPHKCNSAIGIANSWCIFDTITIETGIRKCTIPSRKKHRLSHKAANHPLTCPISKGTPNTGKGMFDVFAGGGDRGREHINIDRSMATPRHSINIIVLNGLRGHCNRQ